MSEKRHGWKGPTAETSRCLAPVRWNGGRLQQLWLIQTSTNGDGSIGLVIEQREEWRDVPNTGASI